MAPLFFHGGGSFWGTLPPPSDREGKRAGDSGEKNAKFPKKTFAKPLDIFLKIVYNITVAFKRHARVAELADAHV